ncbi:hypothetical protein TNCT_62341 [Trichonephila clavata]|uniref:Uncharacterized protein n=1 Tax=Trichonephila clavata TaxID=2740835 RepID=A0A8X6GAG1_TRICU|nr:hypothetical protein TNCT_62341 [Trichonephila clavata]
MKFILVLFFAVLAVASAQRTRYRYLHPVLLPFNPFRGGDDEYAASLGGADVGAYRRSQITRGGFRGYRDTEISGFIPKALTTKELENSKLIMKNFWKHWTFNLIITDC